jgi:Trk K+ transport system NAD-binding subunit
MDGVLPNQSACLVCGLGSLGQYCVLLLKEFGTKVHAIDVDDRQPWEVPNFKDLLDLQLVGDCRQTELLEQAQIKQCRAILLVTSDERVNIAAAFAARSLNPNIRLVIRSAQENLNQLLAQQLGNFVAYEATQLPAAAFALAALGDATQGFFNLDDTLARVIRLQVPVGHPWCDRRQLYELNNPTRRILSHRRETEPSPTGFYSWNPDTRVETGDIITYIETTDRITPTVTKPETENEAVGQKLRRVLESRSLLRHWKNFWQESNQTQRVAILSSFIMLCLFLLGAILYRLIYPEISILDALNVSLVLSLGGFDNLFGGRQIPFPVPWWLYLISFAITVAGTIFVGILYAMLTERVLAARFQFLRRRPAVPKRGHVVLIGLGRVGQRVATLLQELRRSQVGLTQHGIEPNALPDLPVVVGAFKETLHRVNLPAASSVVVVTDDEVANLEIGLMARMINPHCNLVLRTLDQRFAENVARLLPDARVLGAYALAAEAFVGAAFGENILSLFRLHGRTVMVTEYFIKAEDTLNGCLLAEVAYGYGIVPILHQRGTPGATARLMPGEDIRLQADDRLVVLATSTGLQRVERNEAIQPSWHLRVEKAMSDEAIFEGAGAIARISGCDLSTARSLMNQLPAILPVPLYKYQAFRLLRELQKTRVTGSLVDRVGGQQL